MITKLESKPLKQTSFHGELCEICRSVRISGITHNYSDQFIELYFENERRSGGGELEGVKLLGDGEVIVTFKDSKGKLRSDNVHCSITRVSRANALNE